jgi:hypothetical protein
MILFASLGPFRQRCPLWIDDADALNEEFKAKGVNITRDVSDRPGASSLARARKPSWAGVRRRPSMRHGLASRGHELARAL